MEKQRKLKAALYIRVSTEEQALDGQSASAQEETLKQYCHAYDIEVADIYMDLGLSGKSMKDRAELERLVEDSAGGCFDMVLVWKISRLSRSLKDLLYLIDIFERNKVHFASCSEKFDTSTPVGRMTLQLLGSIAEFERNTIVENVRLGLREFARKGGKAASLLGYDNVEKRLQINEREADIIRMIFSLYTNNDMNFAAIARHLNSLGFRTKRGSRFSCSSISYIIRNPAYVGTNRHRINTENEYYIREAHQPIIDEDTWNKAQLKINEAPKSETYHRDTDSLKAQVICMKCNAAMKIFYASSKGKKYKYLRCRSCSNYINYEKLEKSAVKVLLEILDDKSLLGVLYGLMNRKTEIGHYMLEASSKESEIKRLERSKARYLKLFENYTLSDTKLFIDRIAEIESQITNLREQSRACRNQCTPMQEADFERYVRGLRDKLAVLEPSAIRQLSQLLIKNIRVNNGKAEIVLYI